VYYNKETLSLRKYADVFAYFNYATYKEIVHFESYMVKSFITNFEDMSSKNIEQITKNHLFLAEVISNFNDIKKVTFDYPRTAEH
jgi:hypothetical protein